MDGKFLGKINNISFGFGGYQDAEFGVSLDFRYDKGMGVGNFRGCWGDPPSDSAKWTLKEQTEQWGQMVRWVADLCKKAGVQEFYQLKNKPVEVIIEGNTLKSWRLLEEVL